jgi:hypothetical protein
MAAVRVADRMDAEPDGHYGWADRRGGLRVCDRSAGLAGRLADDHGLRLLAGRNRAAGVSETRAGDCPPGLGSDQRRDDPEGDPPFDAGRTSAGLIGEHHRHIRSWSSTRFVGTSGFLGDGLRADFPGLSRIPSAGRVVRVLVPCRCSTGPVSSARLDLLAVHGDDAAPGGSVHQRISLLGQSAGSPLDRVVVVGLGGFPCPQPVRALVVHPTVEIGPPSGRRASRRSS